MYSKVYLLEREEEREREGGREGRMKGQWVQKHVIVVCSS